MFFPFYFWDPTYVLIIIGLIISLIATGYVKRTYHKYDQIKSARGYTAAETAQQILADAGIHDVAVERVRGDLTDFYDSRNKVLKLSDATADSTSVAAIGVAAHEVGHAIQDQKKYVPMRLRAGLVPVANFGQGVSWPLIIFGFFINNQQLINVGIILFSTILLFQIVTLPVEFNASRRALQVLGSDQILTAEELPMARKVLISAALTYVAAAIASFLQVLRLVLLFGGRRNSN